MRKNPSAKKVKKFFSKKVSQPTKKAVKNQPASSHLIRTQEQRGANQTKQHLEGVNQVTASPHLPGGSVGRDEQKPAPRVKINGAYLKIGQAARTLGVSIDTLRRWERAGKITTVRTPGGTRLYHISTLKEINPAVQTYPIETYQTGSVDTETLLKKAESASSVILNPQGEGSSNSINYLSTEDSSPASPDQNDNFKKSLITKFLISSAFLSLLTLFLTGSVIASYFLNPRAAQRFYQAKAAVLLSPFHTLAEGTMTIISPRKARQLGLVPPDNPPPITYNLKPVTFSDVLAVTTSSPYLEINEDTQINGSLFVRDNINNLKLEATPSANSMEFISGGTSLTVTKTAKLDQDVSTTATPGFASLNLSGTKDQLVFQSGGSTGTLTWTPTAARVITLPDLTTTLVGKDTTDTLTNKSLSGSSNTFTNLPNSALTNNKISVTAGTNLTGGGDINLGSSATIALKDSVTLTGTLAVGGASTLSSTLAVTGATTLSSTLSVTGATTLSGNVGIGYTGSSTITFPSLGLAVQGNIGIGTTSPQNRLQVLGGAVLGSNYGAYTAPQNGMLIQGNVGIGTTATGDYALYVAGKTNITGSLVTGLNPGSMVFIGSDGSLSQNNSSLYWDNSNTRLGIGTSNPDYTFRTQGTGYFSGFLGIGSSMSVSGNVGIGQSASVTGLILASGGLRVNGYSDLTGNVGVGGTANFNSLVYSTGSFLSANGSATTPSHSFTSSTSTGLWSPSANALSITTNGSGTNGITITASGLVGLGTTAPLAQLHNTGGTLFGTLAVADLATGGDIGTAASTVDIYTSFNLSQTTATQTITLANPTNQTAGRIVYLSNTGTTPFTFYGSTVKVGDTTAAMWDSNSWNLAGGGGLNQGTVDNSTLRWNASSSQWVENGNVLSASNGTLSINGNLGVGTTGSLDYNMKVLGTGYFSSFVGIGSSLNISGNVGIGQSLTVSSASALTTLNVSGISSLVGNVGIGGTASFNSLVYSTGSFLAGNGSATTPSYSFTSSTSTGLWSPSANALSLTTNGSGTSGLTVTAAGLVGIGITSPSQTFQVNSGSNSTVITSTGNLGLGTSSPNNKLQVIGGGVFGGDFGQYSAPTNGLLVQGNVGLGSTGAVGYGLDVWGTGRITGALTVGGNIGVGTSVNVSSAGIFGSVGTSTLSVSGNSTLSTLTVSGNVGLGASATITSNLDAGSISTSTLSVSGNTTLSTLTTSGNVGIGKSLSVTNLTYALGGIRVNGYSDLTGNVGIGGTASFNSLVYSTGSFLAGNGSATTPSYSFTSSTSTGLWSPSANALSITTNGSGTNGITVTASGLVGIGITSPSQTFQVNSGSNSTVITSTGNLGLGTSSPNNKLQVIGGGVFGGDYGQYSAPTNGLLVQGNVGLGSTGAVGYGLDVWGNARISSALTVGGNIGVGASVNAASAGIFGSLGTSTLSVSGASNLSTLTVSGNAGIGGSLTTTGLNYALGGLRVNGFSDLTGNVGVGQSLNVSSAAILDSLSVTKSISAATIGTSGNVGIGASINVVSAGIFGSVGTSTLSVSGNSTLSTLTVSGNVGLGASASITSLLSAGSLSSSGPLVVSGTSFLQAIYGSSLITTGNITTEGNLGIGTSVPNARLSVQGNVGIGYTGITQVIPVNGLAVSGNVGIGTTTANSTLSVAGNAHIGSLRQGISAPADGLLVDGNVGIGATTSTNKLDVWGNARITGSLIVDGDFTLGGSNTGSQFLANDGSASAPGYSFQDDNDSGLWRPGTNLIALTTNGAGALQSGTTINGLSVNSNGNIGIGTSNPDYTFRTQGTGYFSGFLGIGSSMSVSGNVGIGGSLTTTGLDYATGGLRVNGYSDLTGNVGIGGTATFNSLMVISGNLLPSANDTYDLGSDALRWNNLYLGPSTLHLGSSILDEYTLSYDTTNNRLGFNVNGSGPAEVTFDSSGNVGIGNTNPIQRFQINPPGTSSVVITSTGNIGIGTTSPIYPLEISSSLTTGTVFNLSYPVSTTLTGNLTGSNINLNSGKVNPDNSSVTGAQITLPTTTTTSGSSSLKGLVVTFGSGSGINNNSAGTLTYTAADLSMPALTQTQGALTANGVLVTTPTSITTGGTANAVNVSATGVGAGSLNAINIGTITGGDGTEIAVNVASGWDTVLKVGSTTVINGSGVTQVAGGGTGIGSYTIGDLLYASATGVLTNLGIGTSGQVLATTAGLPVWANISGSSCVNCLTNNPTGTQNLSPTGQATTGLSIRQTSTANPSQDIFNVTDSTGATKYFYVDKDGNVSSGSVSSTTITLTPGSDTTALTLVGTNVTTQSLAYFNSKNAQGTIFNIAYGTNQTLTGSLTGQAINFTSLGIGASNQSVTGTAITMPGVTNANTEGTKTYTGVNITTSSGLNQTGAGSTISNGISVTIPALTQTAGTLTGNGVLITTPSSITTGGTASGLNISATGVGTGTLYGINLSGISGGAGTETALILGSGWDTLISNANFTVKGDGNVGIGTSTPTYQLQTTGNVGLGASVTVTSNLDAGSISTSTLSVSGNTTLSTLTTSGNVGIGKSLSVTNLTYALGGLRVNGYSDLTGNVGIGGTASFTSSIYSQGSFYGINGSATAPAYSFTNSTSTGLWSPSANALSLTTNGSGTNGITITASGLIGIGITSPSQTFQVNSGSNSTVITSTGNLGLGTSSPNNKLQVIGGGVFGGDYGQYSAPTNGLLVQGNVGLGSTGAVGYGLDVWGTGRFSSALTVGGNLGVGTSVNVSSAGIFGSLGTSTLSVSSASTLSTLTVSGNAGIGGSLTTTGLDYATGGLRVNGFSDLTGNVGIGGTANFNSLVYSTGSFLSANGSATAPAYSFTGSTNSGLWSPSVNALSLTTNGSGTSGLTVTANGNVGIGLTNPSGLLDVNGKLTVLSGGNVGIGFTSPAATLDVIGTSMLRGTAGVLGLTVTSAGNVGVGTTAPLGNLHVVGQCVAKGTRIRRRRRNTSDGGDEGDSSKVDWEDVPVEDIKPGDEVLSLNDSTGKWEWHKVEATLDKGIQTLYRLETEFGKWIETTSEHPYLVRNEELFAGTGLFVESNINQKPRNQEQTKSNSHFNIQINQINHNIPFLNLYATDKITIANPAFIVNKTILADKEIWVVKGTAMAAANQPAARFISNSDNIENKAGSTLFTTNTLAGHSLSVKNAKWLKVSQIHAGQYIATSEGWEKIVNITKTSRKQTYDLQIEGTHNFVANDIVAHNTIIMNGNLGVGTTGTASYGLDIWGTGRVTSALTVGGNIGVGASVNVTSAGIFGSVGTSALSVSGNTTLSTLTVSGNVGLGATASVTSLLSAGSLSSSGPLVVSGTSFLQAIYGSSLTTTGNITTEGNLGIGTSVPNARLSVQGNVGIGYTGITQVIPANGLAVSGNMGIGTTTANSTLSVAGGAHIGSIRQGISAPTDGLFVDGNVGIGATTSSNKLDVWGNARITGTAIIDSTLTALNALVGYSGVTAPASGLAVFGNVGVGTTSPAGALHVVGQCVTGDTKLRRRRRRKGKGESKKGEDEWEEVPIKDIQAGDEILSMDVDGTFTWNKVKGLMDMGLQDTFKLITNRGKQIRTTGNHPYFVLEKRPAKVLEKLYTTFEIDQSNRLEDMGTDSVVALASSEIEQFISVKISKKAKKNILQKYYSNKRKLFGPEMMSLLIIYAIWSLGLKAGRLIIDKEYPNYENNIALFINRIFPEIVVSFKSIGHQVDAHRVAWSRATKKRTPSRSVLLKTMANLDFEESLATELLHSGLITGDSQSTRSSVLAVYQSPLSLSMTMSDAKWIPAQAIRKGMLVATIDGWEVITAIYKTGVREQVFDIEVENTHNFIGNDIVAHNTIIMNGNLGIGTTSPSQALELVGTMQLRPTAASGQKGCIRFDATNQDLEYSNDCTTFQSLGATAGGWSDQGTYTRLTTTSANVGIGVTYAPIAKLQISGIGSSTGLALLTQNSTQSQFGLAVLDNGNVGIGTTAPSQLFQAGTGGSVLAFTSAGNLGIGTTTPNSKLSVIGGGIFSQTWGGAIAPASGLIVEGNVGIGTSAPTAAFQVNPSGTSAFVVQSGGNVGIGTTAPGTKLDVLGGAGNPLGDSVYANFLTARFKALGTNSQSYIQVEAAPSSANAGYLIQPGNAAGGWGIVTNNSTFLRLGYANAASNAIGVIKDGTAGITIQTDGNVGIGDATPSYALEVAGNIYASGNITCGGGSCASTTLAWSGLTNPTANLTLSMGSYNTTFNTTGASPTFYIDGTNGRIGIGTASPNHKLSIVSASSSGLGLHSAADDAGTERFRMFLGDGTGGYVDREVYFQSQNTPLHFQAGVAGNTEIVTFLQGGNVGIGFTSPAATLDVIGTSLLRGTGGTYGLAVTNAGSVGIGTASPATRLHVVNPAATAYVTQASYGLLVAKNSGGTDVASLALGGSGYNAVMGITTTGSNMLFGFSDGATFNERVRFQQDGNVGIGTASPGTLLDVNGNVRLSSGGALQLINGSGNGTAVLYNSGGSGVTNMVVRMLSTDLVTFQSNGNVGIGAASPAYTLDVTGNIYASGNITCGGGSCASTTLAWSGLTNPTANLTLSMGSYNTQFNTTGGTGTFYIDGTNGRIGIGTASPNAQLEVADVLAVGNTTDGVYIQRSGTIGLIMGLSTDGGGYNDLLIRAASSGNNQLYLSTGGNVLINQTAGNVGIGTSMPQAKLSIQGNVGIGYTGATQAIPVNGLAVFGNVGIGITTANSTLSIAGNAHIGSIWQGATAPANGLLVDGNVGIGFTSPAHALDINGNLGLFAGKYINFGPADGTSGYGLFDNSGTLQFKNSGGSWADFSGSKWLTSGSNIGYLTGNVGIGTTAPAQALQVVGTVQVTQSGSSGCLRYNSATTQLQWSNDCIAYQAFSAPAAGGWTYDSINNYIRLTTTSSNVGIGTTSPANFKLQLAGSIGPDQDDTYDLGSNTARWRDAYLGPGSLHIGTSTSDEYILSYDTTGNWLNFNANGSGPAELVLDSSGNLGIGTSVPNARLSIQGSVGIGYTGANQIIPPNGLAVFGNVGIGVTTANSTLSVNGNAVFGTGYAGMSSPTNGMLIQGNVGIGTTAPTAAFQVNPSGTSAFVVQSGGNVGIGTTGPSGLFHVKTTPPTITATGGTIAQSGGYTIHTFTGSGTFTPSGSGGVEYLVVGGGGGGGGSGNGQGGGGGGSGGFVTGSVAVTAQGYTVTIGGGGSAGTGADGGGANGNQGSSSVFGSITAVGGGYGASTSNGSAGSGGSGGGARGSGSAGSGTAGQGNTGGTGSNDGSGGGGGAGAVGANGVDPSGGNGGYGLSSSISGSSATYGGGGGGGGRPSSSGTCGTGGPGGGGTAGGASGAGAAGTANTGGGGGGGCNATNTTTDVKNGGAGGSGIVIIRYRTDPVDSLIVNSLGNVGIGFTSPNQALQVAADIDIISSLSAILGANGTQFSITGSTGTNLQKKLTLGLDTTDNYGVIQAGNTSGTAYNLLLQPWGGNVGIGTSAPTAAFQVNPSGTSAFVVQSGGNVGIGTAGPGANFHLSSASNTRFYFEDTSAGADEDEWGYSLSSGDLYGFTRTDAGTDGNNWLIVDRTGTTITDVSFPNGNVGIGTASPGAQLDLSTDSARKLTTTTWTTGSDARIKTNVQSISNALDIIRAVRPVKYHYTPEFLSAHPSVKDTDYYNFIAQEYQQVFPDSVTEIDGLLYLNSSNMIPYAIAGIQEQQAEINSLQSGVSSLQTNQATTSAQLNSLQSSVFSLQTTSASQSATLSNLSATQNAQGLTLDRITQAMAVTDTGNIGIGTTAPLAKLQVTGDSGQLLNISTTTSSLFNVSSSGNVGIGTSDPQFTLEINGTGKLNDSAWTYASDLRLKENINSIDGASALSAVEGLNPITFDYIDGGPSTGSGSKKNRSGFIAQEVQQVLPNLVTVGSDGMLGLRTEEILPYTVKAIQEQQAQINNLVAQQATVSAQLDLQKTALADGLNSLTRFVNNPELTLRTDNIVTEYGGDVNTQNSVDPTGLEPVRPIFLGSAPEPGGPTPWTLSQLLTNLVNTQASQSAMLIDIDSRLRGNDNVLSKLTLDQSGNLSSGVGFVAPHVLSPEVSTGKLQISGDSGQLFSINNATSSLFNVSSAGNVGIGTTNPGYRLQVIGDSGNTALAVSSSGDVSVGRQLSAASLQAQSLDLGPVRIASVSGNLIMSFSGQNVFSLDSTGNMKLAGTITSSAGAFDVAETYKAKDDVEAGDVVSLVTTSGVGFDSPEVNGSEVQKSGQPYDSTIIGIISTKPGLTLSSDTLDGKPVALNGRVPVKVSTENGPITVGDYLTSSSIPGVAMKATKPGQVVGKALEAFDGTNGTVCPAQQKTTLSDGSLIGGSTDSGNSSLSSSYKITQSDENVTGTMLEKLDPQPAGPTPSSLCGKTLAFVNVTFADPGNFLASLSMDDQGNLIVSKLKAGSITLDPSLVSTLHLPGANTPGVGFDSPGVSAEVNLSTKLTSLEDRIKSLENVILEGATRPIGPDNKDSIGTSSLQNDSTPSAQIAGIATDSAQLADSHLPGEAEATPSSHLEGVASTATSSASLDEIPTKIASSSPTPRNDDITLELTSPDLLLASDSAHLEGEIFKHLPGGVVSEATVSGLLTAYNLNVQEGFKSLGKTTLADTLVAGQLTIDGTTSISGSSINSFSCHPALDAGSINNIDSGSVAGMTGCGILFIQNSSLAQGLDILNGTFTFSKDGTLTVSGTVLANQFAVKKDTTAGVGTILAGQTDAILENAYVEENSVILITPHQALTQTIAVADRIKGGFRVALAKPEVGNISFDYLIIGVRK